MIRYVKLSDVEKMIDDAERVFQETEDDTEVGYMASDINLDSLPTYDIEDDCRGRRVVNLVEVPTDVPEEVLKYKEYRCPSCSMKVSKLMMHYVMGDTFNYCPSCGVKLVDE